MTSELKINKISKKEFKRINEDDVMFITNPGRMGDEDGITFIVRQANNYIAYRVDGWMYPKDKQKITERISLNHAKKQFPKWYETWENANNKNYHGKYKYLYMGFGNGLQVDNSIYEEFKPFLDKRVEEHLKKKDNKDDIGLRNATIFSVWESAFLEMIENKKQNNN